MVVMLGNLRSLCFILALLAVASAEARVIRICASSNNLPFSNEQHQGFENQIIDMVARQLAVDVRYVWIAPSDSSYLALEANRCDLIPGVAGSDAAVVSTRPYYQSSYVFVTRRARRLGLRTLDDPRLKGLTLGLHTPAHYQPATSWVKRVGVHGLQADARNTDRMRRNAVGSSAGALMEAVNRGQLDAAVVWGPLATHYARDSKAPLELAPLLPSGSSPAFAAIGVSMGVSRRSPELVDEVQRALDASRAEINAILDQFGVPRQVSHVDRIHNAQILRPPH